MELKLLILCVDVSVGTSFNRTFMELKFETKDNSSLIAQ